MVLTYFQGSFCRQKAKLKRSRSQSHCLPSTWGPQPSGASPGCSHSWGWSLDIFPPGPPPPMTTPSQERPGVLRETGQWTEGCCLLSWLSWDIAITCPISKIRT